MARKILILGRSIRHANAYARVAGLERGYRPVVSAGQVRNTRNAELHILPSFLTRPDRHSILAALRHSRLEVFYVDPEDFKDPADATSPAPAGPTERDLEVAYRYHALRETMDLGDEDPAAPARAPRSQQKARKPRTPATKPAAVAPADFFGS